LVRREAKKKKKGDEEIIKPVGTSISVPLLAEFA
jgi:hypothetical protein